jgi:hypothetical protein
MKITRLIVYDAGADQDQENGASLASSQMFMKEADRQKNGKRRLKIEQERPGDSRETLQPDEQKNWSQDASRQDNGEKEGKILALYRRFSPVLVILIDEATGQ